MSQLRQNTPPPRQAALYLYLVGSSLVFLFMLAACQSPDLNYTLKSQSRLHRKIEDLNERRDRFIKVAKEQIEETQENLKDPDLDLSRLPRYWKTRLRKIEYEYRTLTQKLDLVKEEAERYFKNLTLIHNSIKDSTFKQTERKENTQRIKAWTDLLQNIEADLDSHAQVIRKAEDYHKVLLGNSLRQNRQTAQRGLTAIHQQFLRIDKSLESTLERLEQLIQPDQKVAT